MEQVTIEEQRLVDGKKFPLVFSPSTSENSFQKIVSSRRDEVYDLLRSHKGILFRGFDLTDGTDFHNAVTALQLNPMDYIGGAAVRTQITPLVFTANESPASEKIPFHHEMSQVKSNENFDFLSVCIFTSLLEL